MLADRMKPLKLEYAHNEAVMQSILNAHLCLGLDLLNSDHWVHGEVLIVLLVHLAVHPHHGIIYLLVHPGHLQLI